MLNSQIDPLDRRILHELTKNARMPIVQLAKKMKISNSLAHQRIQKLKDNKVIDKAVYLLNPETLGYETYAFTQVMLESAKMHTRVQDELRKIPEIVECANIAGRYAILVKIFARNNQHLRDVIYNKITTIDGVEGTNTTIAFEMVFTRSLPVL